MRLLKKHVLAASIAAAGLTLMTQVSQAGTVSTDGSTSMEKLVGILAESFQKANPSIKVTYSPTGSGSGITAALEGRCDIGLSSRSLKPNELTNLKETPIALDGIILVVNKTNSVKDLTVDQVRLIYTGHISNWKAVGGPDRPIVLIGREAGSGTRDGFESATKTKDKCLYRQELTSTGDVITTVAKNKNAVGYASLSAISKKVKTLTIDGVEANEQNILSMKYKLQRPFVFVTKRDAKLSEDVARFIDYATKGASADLYKKAGVIPVR